MNIKFKIKKTIVFLTVLIFLISVAGSQVYAASVDFPQKGTLTINTKYGTRLLDGMNINIYQIAKATSNNGVLEYISVPEFAAAFAGKSPTEIDTLLQSAIAPTAGQANRDLAGALIT